MIVGHCECARGNALCSHMATVLLHIHHQVSCTDKLATWSQRGLIEYETQSTYLVCQLIVFIFFVIIY